MLRWTLVKMDFKRIGNELMRNSSTVGGMLDRIKQKRHEVVISGG
jgi:hypothetical protein